MQTESHTFPFNLHPLSFHRFFHPLLMAINDILSPSISLPPWSLFPFIVFISILMMSYHPCHHPQAIRPF